MKRPILVACLGYIIGIIVGLYPRIGIVLFFILCWIIWYRKNRYLKVFISKSYILIFFVFCVVSLFNIYFLQLKYINYYTNNQKINLVGIVKSDKQEKEYSNMYVIQVLDIKGKEGEKNTQILLKTKKDVILQYGDKIKLKGEFQKPKEVRNEKDFDYSFYLKTQGIYGIVETSKSTIQIIEKKELPIICILANQVKNSILQQIKSYLPKETAGLLCGILIGNKELLLEETVQDFKSTGLSHLLAISGLHVSYIIIRSYFFIKKDTN